MDLLLLKNKRNTYYSHHKDNILSGAVQVETRSMALNNFNLKLLAVYLQSEFEARPQTPMIKPHDKTCCIFVSPLYSWLSLSNLFLLHDQMLYIRKIQNDPFCIANKEIVVS